MEVLEGFVEHIIFQNNENGYGIAVIENSDSEMTIKGIMPYLTEGTYIEAYGEYVDTPNYGLQFNVTSFMERTPDDSEAIRKYLASGAIKGIRKATADKIVDMFGDDTFRIMEDAPEELARVKGISKKKALEIAEYVLTTRTQRAAMIFLSGYSISMNLAVKIYNYYGDRIYTILKQDPYRIAYDINGVGFKTVDKIASEVGIAYDSRERVACGVIYVLEMAQSEGHTYLPEGELKDRAARILGVTEDDIEDAVTELSFDKRLRIVTKQDERQIYTSQLYKTEAQTAYMLSDLNIKKDTDEEHLERLLKAVTDDLGIELEEKQKTAVREAVKCGVSVITGGPGTGKTTTINTLIRLLEIEGEDYCLAAPTGRAAKRMSEATKRPAQTIHRLLEFSGSPDDEIVVGRDSGTPIETDYVIIDEMSMVDIRLFNLLLRAIVPGTTLVLVGDVNQLPSVGPGCVLNHIIESGLFTTVSLTEIFRQAKESDIVVNAHRINRGETIPLDNRSKDFFFLERNDPETVVSVIVDLITRKLPEAKKIDPDDIQLLSPSKKGVLGVERLNVILRDRLNPSSREKDEYERGDGVVFREGDKVMQIKNDYQLEWEIRGNYNIAIKSGTGVFNGDIGRIRVIDLFLSNATVEYDDGRLVNYSFKQMEELTHAYAVTVHKSQGSEYPCVIMPVCEAPRMLLSRNILYTAVTRARNMVFLVGSSRIVSQMIENNRIDRRYCGFLDRLKESGEDRAG